MSKESKERKRLRRLRWRQLHREQWLEEKRQYARRFYERKCREQGKTPKPYQPAVTGALNFTHRKEILGRFGITEEEFDDLFRVQNGRCAICREKLKTPYTASRTSNHRAAVDHDHKTNIVRGILCIRCNLGLGNFLDDTWRLKRAIAYLEVARPFVREAAQEQA